MRQTPLTALLAALFALLIKTSSASAALPVAVDGEPLPSLAPVL